MSCRWGACDVNELPMSCQLVTHCQIAKTIETMGAPVEWLYKRTVWNGMTVQLHSVRKRITIQPHSIKLPNNRCTPNCPVADWLLEVLGNSRLQLCYSLMHSACWDTVRKARSFPKISKMHCKPYSEVYTEWNNHTWLHNRMVQNRITVQPYNCTVCGTEQLHKCTEILQYME